MGGWGGVSFLPLQLRVDEDRLLGGVQLLVVGGLREVAGSNLPLRCRRARFLLVVGMLARRQGDAGGRRQRRPAGLLRAPAGSAAGGVLELDGGAGLRGLRVLQTDDVSQGGVARVLQLLQLVLGQAASRDAVDLRRSKQRERIRSGTWRRLDTSYRSKQNSMEYQNRKE